jgi:hypothetical protein
MSGDRCILLDQFAEQASGIWVQMVPIFSDRSKANEEDEAMTIWHYPGI